MNSDLDLLFRIKWLLHRNRVMVFFRHLIRWFGKVFSYAVFLWNDVDWDYVGFLQLIQFKLKRMSKELIDNEDRYKEIVNTINMIQDVLDEKHLDDLNIKYDEKWGFVNLDFSKNDGELTEVLISREKVLTKEDEKQERKEFKKFIKEEQKLTDKAYKDVFSYIATHIQKWWS